MRNKTKTLFIGGAFACIGSLSGHGQTFREKLDAYFAEHAQEIQKSIREWDAYNLHKPEYRITEQELKDVVMRSYGKTIDWMQLSMMHQIRFFDYHRAYLHEGDSASLKKRFDCEQIRIRALRELGDMIEKFTARGINYPKLAQYQQECTNYVSNPEFPDSLLKHLLQTFGRDISDTIAGDRRYYERTANDEYAIERLNRFWGTILFSGTPGQDWTGRLYPYAISTDFHNGYCAYTKWNPNAYPANWRAVRTPYPDYCFDKHKSAIDEMFREEGLAETYSVVMKLLPEYIDISCSLYRTYRDIILELLAEKSGKLKKASVWHTWVSKDAHEALHIIWSTDFNFIFDSLGKHREFAVVTESLKAVRNCLIKSRNTIRELKGQ